MASNIPTRRVTRATRLTVHKDENAVNRPTRTTTTTRAKPPSATANAPENAKPVVLTRVTASTAATRAKTAAPASKVDPAAQNKRKREALGEVPKPSENKAAKPVNGGPGLTALKGKEKVNHLKEKFEGVVIKKSTTTTTTARAPLRVVHGSASTGTSTAATRRTRATPAPQPAEQPQPLQVLEEVKEEVEEVEEVLEDDAMAVDPIPEPKRFVAARASAAAAPSVIPSRTPRRSSGRPVVRQEQLEEDEEAERAFKKRRTSSDLPEEAAVAEVEGVVIYDDVPEADPNGDQWVDLDAEDTDDPLMVSEYVVEIFDYLKNVEQVTMPNPRYMENQKDLAWKMRGILTDWLIQVHSRFKLLPETLFLCVNIIDRFLSARVVSLAKLQLVGITCMFIAAKVEEIVAPSATNFLYCAHSSYNESEILQAERYVLKTIDWNLSYPNPIHFLRRVSKADEYNIQVRTIAKYLLEIQCLEWRLIAAPPSLLAAASIWLARIILGFSDWTPNLAHYSSYPESALVPTANLMLNYVLKPVRHESFFKKYASKKFLKASVFVRNWATERWPENGAVSLPDELPELKAAIRHAQMAEEAQAAEDAVAQAQAEAIAAEEALAKARAQANGGAYWSKPLNFGARR
ncbi:cyclin-like protein [Fomitopsis serialis]|uniref:cyclin-like protein n=1 Tax=Fomitopsis serialis TaxID=139415 RepID=UPI0020082F83|nr:cyclin-like protein [Neoantrodia serialis]KAH9926738.1 cyclin-like protein [Neoantrodia serialis]